MCDSFDSSISPSLLVTSEWQVALLDMNGVFWLDCQRRGHLSSAAALPITVFPTVVQNLDATQWQRKASIEMEGNLTNQGERMRRCIHSMRRSFFFLVSCLKSPSAPSFSQCRFWILWWCQGSEGNGHKRIICALFPIPQISIGCRPWTWHCNFLVPHMSNEQLFLKLWFGEGSTRLFFNLIVIFDCSARRQIK